MLKISTFRKSQLCADIFNIVRTEIWSTRDAYNHDTDNMHTNIESCTHSNIMGHTYEYSAAGK